MKFGTAKADITPDRNIELAGYTGRLGVSQGIESALETNVFFLGDKDGGVFLIALDTLFSSDELETQVRSNLSSNIDLSNHKLIFIASHTHYAPSLDSDKVAIGRFDQEYLAKTAMTVSSAIIDCYSNTGAISSMRYSQSNCPYNVYRRKRIFHRIPKTLLYKFGVTITPNLSREVFNKIQLYDCLGEDRKVEAVIWSWPCHPVNSPYLNKISADFPGEIRSLLRSIHGNEELSVIYLPGFAGDIRAKSIGWNVGFKHRINQPFQNRKFVSTPSSYDELIQSISSSVISSANNLEVLSLGSEIHCRDHSIKGSELLDGARPFVMRLQHIKSGEFELLLASAEVCSTYYKNLNEMFGSKAMLSGYAGSVFGYLPSRTQITEGGYEVSGFMKAFNLEGAFHKNTELSFVNGVKKILGIEGENQRV